MGEPGLKLMSSQPRKLPSGPVWARVLFGQALGGGGALVGGSLRRREVVANCAAR
jgi:hypothetical protein